MADELTCLVDLPSLAAETAAPGLPTIDNVEQLLALLSDWDGDDTLKTHLIARARLLDCDEALPDGWASDAPSGPATPPRSRITLFKVGRFKHPRFGRWNITRDVLEKFVANFKTRGRVPIDFDHAPEHGGSTIAAGWITNLVLQGDELKADVEWTDLGAGAIRKKRYLFISPTWSLAGVDETGAKIGPKLLGAGLTNRPFFALPALNLSASFSGEGFPFATAEPDRCPCPTCAEDALTADERDRFERHWAIAVERGIKTSNRATYEHHYWRRRQLHGTPSGEVSIADMGVLFQQQYWDPIRARQHGSPQPVRSGDMPSTIEFAAPAGLDDEGLILHAQVMSVGQEHNISDYTQALRVLTGAHVGVPLQQTELPPDIPDEEAATVRALERRVRALAAREQIGEVDAAAILDLDDEIAEAQAETGYSETAWLDTSRDLQPKPWSTEDWERDSRRAASIEMAIDREVWQAGAEAGQDLVYEHAVQERAAAVAKLHERREQWIAEARQRENHLRREALNEELVRRARKRLNADSPH